MAACHDRLCHLDVQSDEASRHRQGTTGGVQLFSRGANTIQTVAAVEGVWWYWRRLVRVRFGPPNEFGETIYYIPKWAPLRALYSNPADELRRIVSEHQSL